MGETNYKGKIGTIAFSRDGNAYAAVGRAAGMLMTYPSFAQLPFGQIMRILAGQINRGHYCFAIENKIPVGFFGWALTSESAAERWLTHNDDSAIGDGKEGDCVAFNIWHIVNNKVSAPAVTHFRETFADKHMLFAKRRYNNGRVKPIRIPNTRKRLKSTSFEALRGDNAQAECFHTNVAH